ncbi:Phage-related minor tail protein [Actinobacillus lignieresii]|uniref:phage tail tape measure protein n=1 Tax=Actinobacillus lignieresii TaxID=720 RepID=UPI000F6B3EDA|nr:phage tail tape measure protein [Actinobacillus lignieresii]VEB25772.1 Phage-related minor tail protein [Actinobacillus lignieresii]
MAKNMKVQLELTAKDSASPVLNQAAKTAEKAFKDTERAAQRSSNAQSQAAQQAANATQTSNKKIEQSYRNARKVAADVATARETLGVRSENAIQREIEQTRAAYDRLKRSGVASQNELRRASEATKQRVKELNAELGKTSFGDKAAGLGRGLMNVGVGLAAGAAVTKPKMMAAAEYDMALARVADTGYSGGTIEEKTQGKEKIHQAIKGSITQYGGTKEDALSAINELMAQGQVSVDDALSLLPTIQQNATATGASTSELTSMINSMLRFGVKQEEIQTALDYMNASGKAGGFELKDMAQYFPQILANAGANGLSGLEDLKKVGINLQQVYGVSGGAAETATNLNNYYSKVKATSTADNVESIEFTNANGKKQSIDMKKSMQKYMKEGQNASEALLSIIGDILENDKEYQSLLTQYQTAKDGDKKAIMQKVSKYIEGTKVAEIMPDLQAGLATYAMINDKTTAENVKAQYKIADKGNYNKESFKWISQQSAFAFQVAKNNAEMTQLENFQKLNDMTAEVAKTYSSLAQELPNLNSALVGATDAVIAFGSALAASSVLDLLTGGKAKSGVLSKVADVAKGGISGGAVKGTGGAGLLSKLGIVGLAFTPTEANKGEQESLDKMFADMKAKGNYPAPKMNAQPSAQSSILWNLPNVIGTLKPKVEATSQVLSNYQADFQAFGQTISAGLQAGLASQSHTIANQITVELDGSVVAEKVSEYQFNFNKRMA